MFLAIAHFPNAGVRTLPVFADPLKTIADLHPNVVGGGADVLVGEIKRVHELPIDVSLELRNSCIADANRPGFSIAFPVIQRLLGKLRVTLNRKENCAGLFGTGVLGSVIFNPAQEGSSLVFEAEAQ